MNGIGDYVTSLKETRRLAAQVMTELKGDAPGHPFRGNQYDGGSGSAGDSGTEGHSVEYGKSANGHSIATYHGEVDLSGDKVPENFRNELKKASEKNVDYFFYTPKGESESMILPSKQTPQWYDRATPRDINRVTVPG